MFKFLTIVNEAGLPAASVNAFCNAVYVQLYRDVQPAWSIETVPYASSLRPSTGSCLYLVKEGRADALGTHELGKAIVFVDACARAGYPWTAIASHEILEGLVNPTVKAYELSEGVLWAREICDPVMSAHYEIDGVKLSNFVLPAFFAPEASGPFDHLGLLTAPLSVLRGSYANVLTLDGAPRARQRYA